MPGSPQPPLSSSPDGPWVSALESTAKPFGHYVSSILGVSILALPAAAAWTGPQLYVGILVVAGAEAAFGGWVLTRAGEASGQSSLVGISDALLRSTTAQKAVRIGTACHVVLLAAAVLAACSRVALPIFPPFFTTLHSRVAALAAISFVFFCECASPKMRRRWATDAVPTGGGTLVAILLVATFLHASPRPTSTLPVGDESGNGSESAVGGVPAGASAAFSIVWFAFSASIINVPLVSGLVRGDREEGSGGGGVVLNGIVAAFFIFAIIGFYGSEMCSGVVESPWEERGCLSIEGLLGEWDKSSVAWWTRVILGVTLLLDVAKLVFHVVGIVGPLALGLEGGAVGQRRGGGYDLVGRGGERVITAVGTSTDDDDDDIEMQDDVTDMPGTEEEEVQLNPYMSVAISFGITFLVAGVAAVVKSFVWYLVAIAGTAGVAIANIVPALLLAATPAGKAPFCGVPALLVRGLGPLILVLFGMIKVVIAGHALIAARHGL